MCNRAACRLDCSVRDLIEHLLVDRLLEVAYSCVDKILRFQNLCLHNLKELAKAKSLK